MVTNETTRPPANILVHDFAAAPADVQGDAPVSARVSSGVSITPDQVALDRRLGSNMTAQLVTALRQAGLPARRASPGATPQVHDVVVRGYLVSMYDSGEARRVNIGFDFSAAELTAIVESFQVAAQGYGRRLAPGAASAPAITNLGLANPSGLVVAPSVKTSGGATNRAHLDAWASQTAQVIAARLKTTFQSQGWTN